MTPTGNIIIIIKYGLVSQAHSVIYTHVFIATYGLLEGNFSWTYIEYSNLPVACYPYFKRYFIAGLIFHTFVYSSDMLACKEISFGGSLTKISQSYCRGCFTNKIHRGVK